MQRSTSPHEIPVGTLPAVPPVGGAGQAPVTVAVVADDDVLRQRLLAVLRRDGISPRLARELRDVTADGPFDVVVAAVEPAADHRAGWLAELRRACPGAALLCVTEHVQWRLVRVLLEGGAAAVVRISTIEKALTAAIAGVAAGQLILPAEIRDYLSQPVFSPREKQILALVVMGFSNAEIADTLFVSESTVKGHLSSAFRRLGVRSRKEAVAMILDPEHGFGAGILEICGDERRRGPRPHVRDA